MQMTDVQIDAVKYRGRVMGAEADGRINDQEVMSLKYDFEYFQNKHGYSFNRAIDSMVSSGKLDRNVMRWVMDVRLPFNYSPPTSVTRTHT